MTDARSHAALRLAERYGIRLSKEQMRALVNRIQNGEGVVTENMRDGTKRILITVQEREIIVLWSPVLQFIISVFPRKKNLPTLKRPGGGGRAKSRNGRANHEGRRPEVAPEIEHD